MRNNFRLYWLNLLLSYSKAWSFYIELWDFYLYYWTFWVVERIPYRGMGSSIFFDIIYAETYGSNMIIFQGKASIKPQL